MRRAAILLALVLAVTGSAVSCGEDRPGIAAEVANEWIEETASTRYLKRSSSCSFVAPALRDILENVPSAKTLLAGIVADQVTGQDRVGLLGTHPSGRRHLPRDRHRRGRVRDRPASRRGLAICRHPSLPPAHRHQRPHRSGLVRRLRQRRRRVLLEENDRPVAPASVCTSLERGDSHSPRSDTPLYQSILWPTIR